jgi:hypothetical protein
MQGSAARPVCVRAQVVGARLSDARRAAAAPRALCTELAPCSQRLVDAFGIPDHLVAAPIATSARPSTTCLAVQSSMLLSPCLCELHVRERSG